MRKNKKRHFSRFGQFGYCQAVVFGASFSFLSPLPVPSLSSSRTVTSPFIPLPFASLLGVFGQRLSFSQQFANFTCCALKDFSIDRLNLLVPFAEFFKLFDNFFFQFPPFQLIAFFRFVRDAFPRISRAIQVAATLSRWERWSSSKRLPTGST